MPASREQFLIPGNLCQLRTCENMDQDEDNAYLSGMERMMALQIPIQNEMLIFLGSIMSINYAHKFEGLGIQGCKWI